MSEFMPIFRRACATVSPLRRPYLMPCEPMKPVIGRGFFPCIGSDSEIKFPSFGGKMLEGVRKQASAIEVETRRFYERAAVRATDVSIRELLDDLAQEERDHEHRAQALTEENRNPQIREDEDRARRRLFVLQIVQPGLAGLMDGSVSTLAPVFAAAFATHNSWAAFLVGMAASLGAGISMGFAEALSDDGSLTGRGHPWVRGLICGLMTTLGGIGHTLPFLLPSVHIATAVAVVVVIAELGAIAWVRHRYMETPWVSATLQVVLGGTLVFVAGVLIGSS